MAELARSALVFALVASVAVPAIGLLRGQPLREMLLGGLVLAFATIPEELPILVTVLLALGGRRLAARGALVRRLRAAETIGSATVVLTDKTGTLTENRQHLVEVVGDRAEVLGLALSASGDVDAGGRDAVEASLQAAASAEQVVRDPGARLVDDYPFDPPASGCAGCGDAPAVRSSWRPRGRRSRFSPPVPPTPTRSGSPPRSTP